MDDLSQLTLIVISVASVVSAMALAWLCAKVTRMEQILFTFTKDTKVEDALNGLRDANDKAAGLAVEAVRVARNTSRQVDVTAELGHQNAAGARAVAHDLADSINRADNEPSGEAGAAADAGLRSDPREKKNNS